MLASLGQYQVVIGREDWLKEAVDAERAGARVTCECIVRNTLMLGLDEEDKRVTWLDDAEGCLAQVPPAVETARAIYMLARETFPKKKSIWLAAAALEKEHGSLTSLEVVLKAGVKECPHAEVLWLMAAKERWLSGDIAGARAILVEAFEANPQSEQVWLAAVKLEWESGEFVRARLLLARARDRAPSERIWLKSALLERELGESKEALKLLEQSIRTYPLFFKYYLMAGQILDEVSQIPFLLNLLYVLMCLIRKLKIR